MTLTGYEKREGVAYLSVQNTGAAADISVPLFNYGHYAAADTATGEPFAAASGENARVVLTIPAGYSGTIAIAWQSPAWWRGCEAPLDLVRTWLPGVCAAAPARGAAPDGGGLNFSKNLQIPAKIITIASL